MLRSVISPNLVSFSRLATRPLSTTRVCFNQDAKAESNELEELFYNNDAQSSDNVNKDYNQQVSKKRHPWGVNRAELLGGVAADPEILTAKSGDNFAAFRLFTNVDFRRRDGTYSEHREVHEVHTFAPSLVNYVKKNIKKGSRVYVSGRIHYVERPDFSRRALIKAELVQTIAKPNTGNEFNADQ